MATGEDRLQQLEDKLAHYEPAIVFLMTNQDFFTKIKDNLSPAFDQLVQDAHKLRVDVDTIRTTDISAQIQQLVPPIAQQEVSQQEVQLTTKIIYEVRKHLKPAFDSDLNTLRMDLMDLGDKTEASLKTVNKTFDDFRRDTNKNMATKADIEELELKIPDMESVHSTTSVSSSDSDKGKMIPPAEFSGKRGDWKSFMSRLQFHFINYPKTYPTDTKKILFMITRLGDTSAYKYIQNYVNDFEKPEHSRPAFLTNYELFVKTLRTSFGDAQANIIAEAQIHKLTQGTSSASDYSNKFIDLADNLDWNDAALISAYRRGLSTRIQDLINVSDKEEPKDFNGFKDLAVSYDQKLFAQLINNRNTPNTSTNRLQPATSRPPGPSITHSKPAPTTSTPSTATPMDLSQAHHISNDERN